MINVPTPVVEHNWLFVTGFYDGAMMLRLHQDEPAVEKVWQRAGPTEQKTDALHAMLATPMLDGDYVYGVNSYGELHCLDAKTGDRVWENLTAVPKDRWSNIYMVRNGARVWMFNERGELIISELSPAGFRELSRSKLIEPTTVQLDRAAGSAGRTRHSPTSTSSPATTASSWPQASPRKSKTRGQASENRQPCGPW